MRHGLTKVGALVGAALLLAGCGDSHPIPEANPGSRPADSAPDQATAGGAASAPAPSTGAFTVLTAPVATSAAATTSCNLDAVDGAPPGAKPLPRGASALFAGWAAASSGSAVPSTVTIVLAGSHAKYSVAVPTGAQRPDVAKAQGKPELVTSGYQVNADLSGVPAGTYTVELHYHAAGKAWRCDTTRTLSVQ